MRFTRSLPCELGRRGSGEGEVSNSGAEIHEKPATTVSDAARVREDVVRESRKLGVRPEPAVHRVGRLRRRRAHRCRHRRSAIVPARPLSVSLPVPAGKRIVPRGRR